MIKNLKKLRWIKIIKVSIGSFIAIMTAEMIGLQFAGSAGIITLLSIQNTKKETFGLVAKRLLSLVATVLLIITVFRLHSHPISFALFLFLLGVVSELFGWQGALSVNAVIGTHCMQVAAITLPFIYNECLLVIIGAVIAVIFNFYMPDKTMEIKKDIDRIELQLSQLLNRMAEVLNKKENADHDGERLRELDHYLDEAIERAFENMNNSLNKHSKYYIQYMEMRKSQCKILENVHDVIHSLKMIPKQAEPIAESMLEIAAGLHEKNNADEMIMKFQKIIQLMEREALPVTREEFESRAMLFHVLLDLEEFLILKKEFVDNLTKEQIRIYWSEDF